MVWSLLSTDPGQSSSTCFFFNEFTDLIECGVAFAASIFTIVDINLNLDDTLVSTPACFNVILDDEDIIQYITGVTHELFTYWMF